MTRNSVILAAALSVPALGADKLGISVIETPAQSTDTCTVARNDLELNKVLKSIGWKPGTNNFPDIDLHRNVALVITTTKKKAEPDNVYLRGSSVSVELVEPNDFDEGTGALVVAAPFPNAKRCSLTYMAEVAAKPEREAEPSHVVSVNSAGSDKPAPHRLAVEKKPTLPSKAPPGQP
jgi:hypothetical protein